MGGKNTLKGILSSVSIGEKIEKGIEAGASQEGKEKQEKRREFYRNFGGCLIGFIILATLIMGVLGWFGVLPFEINGVRVSGLGAAIIGAILGIVLTICVAIPVVWLVGLFEMGYQTWLGIQQTLGIDKEVAGNVANLGESSMVKFMGSSVTRWLFPVSSGALVDFFSPVYQLILAQIFAFGVGMALHWLFPDVKKRHIAYLQALLNLVIVGYDGTLSFLSNMIPVITPTWTSGILGVLLIIGVFSFFTGLWAMFSNEE